MLTDGQHVGQKAFAMENMKIDKYCSDSYLSSNLMLMPHLTCAKYTMPVRYTTKNIPYVGGHHMYRGMSSVHQRVFSTLTGCLE